MPQTRRRACRTRIDMTTLRIDSALGTRSSNLTEITAAERQTVADYAHSK